MSSLFLFYKFLLSPRAGSLVKKISWLSIIGVSLGVMALIIVMSVMSGLHASIHTNLLAVEPHVVSYFNSIAEKRGDLKNENIIFQDIFEEQDVIIRAIDGSSQGAIAKGLSAKSFERFLSGIIGNQNKIIGRLEHRTMIPFGPRDLPKKNEIFIGSSLARQLGVFEGDPLYLITPESLLLPPGELPRYEQVIISRIIQTSVHNIDDQMIFYIRGQALQSFRDPASRKIGYEFWLKNPHKASDFKSEVEKLWTNNKTQTWEERNSDLFWALRLEKMMIGIFLSVATIIAAFSIVSVLSLLISQKQSEVVLFEILGLTQKQTMMMFQKLGWILGGLGVGIGFVLGLAISFYMQENPLNILSTSIYYNSELPSKVDPTFVVLVFIIACLLTFVGSFWPTRRILSLSPSIILRRKH